VAIITISRELAALGDEIAQELSKLLGYTLANKKSIEEKIKSYGIADQQLQKYDERKPSFFASLSQDRDDYVHYLKTALLNEAASGNVVIVGRGAGEIFRAVPGVLSVYLGAQLAARIARVKSYFHCDEKRAKQILEQSDQDRSGFHKFFFDSDWKDPDNYHLAFNTGALSPRISCMLIKTVVAESISAETEAHGATRIQELILGQRIKHHLLYDKMLPLHFLEVVVAQGQATLYGVANSAPLADTAFIAANEIYGSIRSEIQVVHEYNAIL
jgi:cytidylate kinase